MYKQSNTQFNKKLYINQQLYVFRRSRNRCDSAFNNRDKAIPRTGNQ